VNIGTAFNGGNFVFSPICSDDAGMLLKAVCSNDFPKSLPLAKIQTLEQAELWCKERALEWKSGECFVWSCRKHAAEKIVGQVTLLPKSEYLALAYWVDPVLWGQGVASEMCGSLLDHLRNGGFEGKIWAGVHSWNQRSSSVLKKLGFERLVSCDENIYEFMLDIRCLMSRAE